MITSDSNKIRSRITGAFFISATVTAIIGATLYSPIFNNTEYLDEGFNHSGQVLLGVIFELILCCSNIGTGIMLFPHLKKYNESAAMGYVMFRFLEVVFIALSLVSALGVLSLSESYLASSSPEISSFQVTGNFLRSLHMWVNILGPNFILGINTFIYSYVFYKTGLVPRKLSIYGLIAAVLIFINSIFEIFGAHTQFSLQSVILSFPIFSYEMILAGWIIVKELKINQHN